MRQNHEIHKVESVHKILAHSYAASFLFFLVGVCLDLFFDLEIFNGRGAVSWGFAFLAFGTFMILWAQRTSRSMKKEHITRETFCRGPYCYTRSPTHWGLFFLLVGFGMVTNAFFVVVSSCISLVFTKLTYLEKEERVLALKYGEPYLEYKKRVKF